MPTGKETPKIEKVTCQAWHSDTIIVDGHNFDGCAGKDTIAVDGRVQGRVLAASPVQLRVNLPANFQWQSRSGCYMSGLKQQCSQFPFPGRHGLSSLNWKDLLAQPLHDQFTAAIERRGELPLASLAEFTTLLALKLLSLVKHFRRIGSLKIQGVEWQTAWIILASSAARFQLPGSNFSVSILGLDKS